MTEQPPGAPRDEASHDALRELLGAHALGQLDPDETAQVERHLAGCAECRADLDAIAPLAAPLARVRPEDLEPADDPPGPDGFPAVLARVRAERAAEQGTGTGAAVVPLRRGIRARWVAAAATFVIGMAAAGIGFGVATRGGAPVEPVPVQAVAPGVTATAGLVAHTWGVEIKLTARGFADGGAYRVVILDRSGRPFDAGAFRGTGANEMTCNLNSAVLRGDATGFVVTDAAGESVVVSRFT